MIEAKYAVQVAIAAIVTGGKNIDLMLLVVDKKHMSITSIILHHSIT